MIAKKVEVDKKLIHVSIGTAVSIVIFLLVMSAQLASWKSDIENTLDEHDDRITHVGEKIVDMRADLKSIQQNAAKRDIEVAKINTKLANIELQLIEIKDLIKEGKGE